MSRLRCQTPNVEKQGYKNWDYIGFASNMGAFLGRHYFMVNVSAMSSVTMSGIAIIIIIYAGPAIPPSSSLTPATLGRHGGAGALADDEEGVRGRAGGCYVLDGGQRFGEAGITERPRPALGY